MGSWSKTLPATSTNAAQTPSFYQDNWEAIEDFFGIEHYSFTSELSGRHIPGIVGVMVEGATSAISALVPSAEDGGTLAFDTTVGAWAYKASAGDTTWKPIHSNLVTTRIQAYASSSVTAASATNAIIPFDAETVVDIQAGLTLDSLSEFNTTSYVFSAAEAGYFYVKASVSVNTNTSSGGDTLTVFLCGSAGTYRAATRVTMSSAYNTMGIETIAGVVSGGTLAFYVSAPADKTTTIQGGAGNTFLRIHRVS